MYDRVGLKKQRSKRTKLSIMKVVYKSSGGNLTRVKTTPL